MVGFLGATIQTLVPSLPAPVTNNAVAAVEIDGRWHVYSFLGLDSTKRWSGVMSRAFEWAWGDDAWTPIEAPAGAGRLAATAQVVRGRVYLFGGYTVGADGSEKSLPNVDVWDPRTRQWSHGTDIPVPTDDAVSGVWRDSLVYLISGWHDRDNIANVQIYDPARNTWRQGTPIAGTSVFGHTGGIVGDAIVYVDGVGVFPDEHPRFRLVGESWRGDIDPSDPTTITWSRLPPHPGPLIYRGAAVSIPGRGMLIHGGSDHAYNYNGIGYDGRPAQPTGAVMVWDPDTGRWQAGPPARDPSMDHRGAILLPSGVFVLGGMGPGQRVRSQVIGVERK